MAIQELKGAAVVASPAPLKSSIKDSAEPQRRPSRVLIVLAFAAIYIIWGSTYLGIKYAIQTLPPFLMAATRFLTAGMILIGWAYLRSRGETNQNRLSSEQWRRAFVIGALLLLCGNGGVTWAEHYLPSGLTALLIASEPLWVVIMNWTVGGGRPIAKVFVGLFAGLAGVALLVSGGLAGTSSTGVMPYVGAGVVIAASFAWASGSVYSLRRPVRASPAMAAGLQMLAGGALLLMVALFTGEFGKLNLRNSSWASLGALAYLVIFGSLIAFTAYSWLLRKVTPARAATYAYVNPVVAVLLGWLIAGEPVTLRMLLAAAVIVASVALITTYGEERSTSYEEKPATSPGGKSRVASELHTKPPIVQDETDDLERCPTHPCA